MKNQPKLFILHFLFCLRAARWNTKTGCSIPNGYRATDFRHSKVFARATQKNYAVGVDVLDDPFFRHSEVKIAHFAQRREVGNFSWGKAKIWLCPTPPSRVIGKSEPCTPGRCPCIGFTAPNVRHTVETSQSFLHVCGRSANHRKTRAPLIYRRFTITDDHALSRKYNILKIIYRRSRFPRRTYRQRDPLRCQTRRHRLR